MATSTVAFVFIDFCVCVCVIDFIVGNKNIEIVRHLIR